MSLTKNQFEKLVDLVIEKILYTEVESYIRDSLEGDFLLEYDGKVGIYYKADDGIVNLPWLVDNGDLLPISERCNFIDGLLASLKELIEKNKAQQDDFSIYLEQIKGL